MGSSWYGQLHWQILIAMVLGVLLGLVGGGEAVPYYDWMGDLFLRLLKMVVIPLIFSSIVVGIVGAGDLSRLGRVSVKAVVYYLGTSALAILTGLFMVNLIRPGVGFSLPGLGAEAAVTTTPSVRQLLLRMIPTNPIQAMAEGDTVGVIVFALLLGLFIIMVAEPGRARLSELFGYFFEAMMRMTGFMVRLAPLGVLALMGKVIGEVGLGALAPLAAYMVTVTLGLFIHAFITLPAILLLVGRRNPLVWVRTVGSALATAFSSASSNAALPLTIEAVRRGRVPERVASFMVPLGATINMDGTALYEGVAAIFIAQAYGIELALYQQGIVFFTALLASIGAAGIPHAGLVMMAIVLQAVGLPLEGVGLIIAVDRVLDMCRTTVNVWSDTVGAAVVGRLDQPEAERDRTAVSGS